MHRSGTSALAKMLSLLGCDLPATLIPAGPGNEVGHWESRAIALFNDQLLAAAGSAWDDWLPVNPRFRDTPRWPDFLEKGRIVLRQEFADSPMFVLKDPRICRILPFWLEVLASEDVEPTIVIPVRNPIEVARSLAARDGLDEYYGLLLWLRHVLDAEAASRGRSRVFVSYDELLQDWEMLAEKIARSTGLVWPRLSPSTAIEFERFLGPDLRHHVVGSRDLARRRMLSPWVADAYAILEAWVAQGEQADGHDRLDCIASSFEQAAPMFARPMLSARETREKLTQSEDERDTLEGERDTLAAERDALVVERDGLAQQRDSAAQERTILHSERDSLTAERDATIAERDALAGALHAEQVRAARDRDERSALEEERDALRAQIAKLEREQAQSANTQRELGHNLALTASTLRQREEEIAQLDAARAQNVAELSRSRDAVSRLEASQAEQRDELIAAQAEIAERFAESAKFTAMLGQHEVETVDLRRELDEMRTEHAVLAASRDAIRADRDAISSENVAARDEIAERFKELSQLTFMLRSSEEIARARDEDVAWLLDIGATVTRLPSWWALVPSRVRQRWTEKRLKHRGLFDAEAYRARYKDVADAKMASLRHYLMHGLREGRSR
jgi:hypothetical protein